MIAFEFIPSTAGAIHGRRIDLAGLARQFAEREEPRPARGKRHDIMRIAMLVLILAGAIGDTVLVAQREALANCLATAAAPAPPAQRAPES